MVLPINIDDLINHQASLEDLNPIEVNVRQDRIEIISFPGPMPPVNNEALKKEKVIVRDYRNRRIGDFLKELDLTEGRGASFLSVPLFLLPSAAKPFTRADI